MRRVLLGMALLLGAGVGHAAPTQPLVLQVANLTCPACRLTIEKALEKLPGVTTPRVDTRAGTVVVDFDPDQATARDIARVITDAGFPATLPPPPKEP